MLVTRSDSQKQASMPKAKTIDALLDTGATVPSSALNVATSDTKSMENPRTFATAHDITTMNARSGPVDVNVITVAGRHAEDEDHKLDDSETEARSPRRDDKKSSDKEPSAKVPKINLQNSVQPVNARKVSSKVSIARSVHMETEGAVETEPNQTTLNNGKQTVSQSPGESFPETGGTGPAILNTKPARSTQSRHTRPAKASVNDSKGRPQRRAKQSALDKLRVKHGREVSDEDDVSDGSQDDGLNIAVQSKQTNAATGRNQKANHFPTPVTEGNVPKKKAETNLNGKLKSIKQQEKKTTASTRTRLDEKSTQDTAAPSERAGRATNAATQKEMANASAGANFAQSLPDLRRTDATAADRNSKHESEDTPPPRRPGALKRPGRSQSRGRRPQVDTPYEFPGTSSNTKKKRRSISRASKASTARAGPARQRMQSESVKAQPDRVRGGSQLPSISRQVSPGIGEPEGQLRKPSVSRRKKDGSRPPPETQGRGTSKERESHVLPTVRSSHAADAEPEKSKAGGRKAAAQEKPGSSQAHAIMIEQDSQSESSSSPSPQKPVNTRSRTAVQEISRPFHLGRPQTPAMIPSSPPGSGRAPVHTLESDKPTIIAFSRQGPRNQGVSSAKKHRGSAASKKVLSDYKFAKAGNPNDHEKTIGLATQLFPPSSQPSQRPSTQAKHTAEPDNVARDDESAFGDFTKDGKNKVLAKMLQKPSTAANELGEEDQDREFAVIDDFEGTTLVDDHERLKFSPKQPTASQVAMPPPNVVTRGKKDPKTIDGPVRLPTKAAAEALPANDTPRPAPVKRVPNVPKGNQTASVPDEQMSTLLAEDVTYRSVSGKRISEAMPTDNTSKLKPSEGQRMAQPGRQARKRGLVEPQDDSPRKRTRVPEEGLLAIPEAKSAHAHRPSVLQSVQTNDSQNRLDRRKGRSSRRSTQASQGVDILGSPYPKDLDVPKQTTALEVFSQQAGLSSDQTERSDVAPTRRLDLEAIPRMVPTAHLGLISSNGKPAPAAPRERSKAVTRIASGTLAEQLLAVKSAHMSEENPFTSSRERKSSAVQGPAANKFREALRQRGIDLSDRPPAVRSEELGDGCFDEVDETLVEPADDLVKANQHTANSPDVSEASRASSPDAAATVLEDVGDWRNSLKPHQSHLFDSLVIAAHKLVRHMVDDERADRTMVADYRRRGEIIVDELQRAHAQEYQQYTENVQVWKIQAAEELAAHGRKLKQRMREAEKARAERKKALLDRNEFDDLLEELVAKLD